MNTVSFKVDVPEEQEEAFLKFVAAMQEAGVVNACSADRTASSGQAGHQPEEVKDVASRYRDLVD